MKRILGALFICCFVIFSCHHSKTSSVITSEKIADSSVVTMRFVVSFVSFGGGIDGVGSKEMQNIINAENQKNCEIQYRIISWGREGEKDFCFPSQNTNCMDDLLKQLKAKFQTNKRVIITENAVSRQGRVVFDNSK